MHGADSAKPMSASEISEYSTGNTATANSHACNVMLSTNIYHGAQETG